MKTQLKARARVRTQWMALAAALVVLAGVLVSWALSQAADRVQVVQLTRAVPSGVEITSEDLTVTGVAYDSHVEGLVPAESLAAVVGRVASIDLEAGALLQVGMWRDAPALQPGEQSVGVVLQQGRLPAGLAQGDTALAAPLQPGDATLPVPVRVLDDHSTAEGDVALTLAVAATDAVTVAQLAATDQLVLVGESVAGASVAGASVASASVEGES